MHVYQHTVACYRLGKYVEARRLLKDVLLVRSRMQP